MTKAEQVIAAITDGFAAGGVDEWEAPEFQSARDLTEQFGCSWDFYGWRSTRDSIINHGKLGGVNLTEINSRTAELAKVVEGAQWDDDGFYTVSVGVPNSLTAGEDEYHSVCDEQLADLQAKLPGWTVEFPGNGNTEADGSCTEDIRLTPPEVSA